MTERWRECPNDKITKYIRDLSDAFDASTDSTYIKLTQFPKYVPKNSLMQFLSRYELYKLIENIPGDIIELGVCGGGGLFSFVQSVFINEPQYQWRNIIGFDTFNGFVEVSSKDNVQLDSHLKRSGAFKSESLEELMSLKKIHEDFRFMNSREQIEIVKGDVEITLPDYIAKNPGMIVSLVYCDLDLYKPTHTAIRLLWDRIPKGGILVLDEGITRTWQGEALALHEIIGIGSCRMYKLPTMKQFYILKS
jgi:hypothetical protein